MPQWTIHPWCHQSCNQPSVADQLRGVQIPDVHPAELVPAPGLLSMSAGDFAEVYAAPEYAGAERPWRTAYLPAYQVLMHQGLGCLGQGGVGQACGQLRLLLWTATAVLLVQAAHLAAALAEAFDAVACCFFLDTAHNVLEYLEVIWHTLKVGLPLLTQHGAAALLL